MITAENITDEQIRELRADVMREWDSRGKKTAWPDGREALALCVSALNPQCHEARKREARARCAELINARGHDGAMD